MGLHWRLCGTRFSGNDHEHRKYSRVIPDHSPSNSRRKRGCDNRPIGLEDTGAILKAFEGWQVHLFPVIHNIVVFMAIRVLTFLLWPESENKLLSIVKDKSLRRRVAH
jgi:hypothetical protein